MRTGFTAQSLAEYAKLRKAMVVWDKYDRGYADAAIEAVAAELGETTDDTKEIKPMMYTDIATDHEYSPANTAHKKCEKALDKLKEAIKDLI